MTARHTLRLTPLCAALALATAALPALAQQDPPARAGRIAYVAGAVSFSPAGTDEWAQAPLNRPLVAGDRLWTEPGARDEAQFGPAIARMDGGTLLGVLAADEGVTQLQLSQGRIDLHVRRVGPGETIEVDTPNLAFVVRAPGDYRIVVAPDGGSTDVAALRGTGDVYGDGNAYKLGPGQGWRFAGQDLDNLGAVPIQPYDDFDRWALARDQRLDHAQSARFVPADMVGYEDLDDNGAWRVVPDYGTVWVPTRVAAGWAPYHDGHWAWIDPWGWTWVDDQPWGYAVSHYGRWANIENRWAWVPSPQRERPVYAPALVAFVGAALAMGAAEGPGVGWFPLGPREAYRPPYHASPAYVSRVNFSNTPIRPAMLQHDLVDPRGLRYANRGVPGALMAMPAGQFAQSAPVGRAARVLPPRLAMSAPLAMAPNARPLPQSRFGAPPAHGLPPAGARQRVAVAHGAPRGFPGGPAFAQRGAAMGAQAGGAPVRLLRPAAAVRPGVPQPHAAGAPQFAGRPGGPGPMPLGAPGAALAGQHPGAPHQFGPGGRTAPLAPASSPYPVHGQGLAGPGPHWAGAGPEAPRNAPGPVPAPAPANHELAFERGHAGHAEGPRAMGRSGMQDMRAGGPEPRPAAAPAPANAQAMAQPHGPAFHGAEHGGRRAPAQAMPAQAMPAQPMLAPQMEAPHPHAPHMNAAPPHQPPQAPPHPQPAPPPHQQAPAPHPEPAQAPPQQGKGGGHEDGKDHGHGHGH
jgi:hypothetical protein